MDVGRLLAQPCRPSLGAEIEPVSRMLSSSFALPGPMRAPDSKTMLTLNRAMTDERGERAVFRPPSGCS
jgi:hypothetical protein